jgi:hypothetical protein
VELVWPVSLDVDVVVAVDIWCGAVEAVVAEVVVGGFRVVVVVDMKVLCVGGGGV